MPADAHVLDDLDPFDLLDLESARLDAYLSWLSPESWSHSTRCASWTVRDVLAHLASLEEYNRSCLDDTVGALVARAYEAGVADMDGFNAWGIKQREHLSSHDLLTRWRADNVSYRRRARDRGRDGWLSTAAGSYPVGLQVFYLASEYATHADDVGAPVGPEEQAERTWWRARFTRYAVREYERPARIYWRDGQNLVQANGEEVVLSDAQLVEAAVGRLSRYEVSPRILSALICLA
ncbi:MAG: maleylpyruvate isomerase family mycothiol-dependent enzyme [Actinomycetes bacterium]